MTALNHYFFFLAQHINIYSAMDHSDDFQDMFREIFGSRQGANATVISHANYNWNHSVPFIGTGS